MTSYAFLLACGLSVPSAFGQLYLITASPNPKGAGTYPATLLRVGQDGKVFQEEQLAKPNVGTEWVGVSYDWRKAVILSGYSENKLIVVDFDKAAIVKKCSLPDADGRSLISSWLAGDPIGQSYEWLETGTDVIASAVVQGMTLDAGVPCDRSFTKLQQEAVQHAVAHGRPGIADVATWDGLHVNIGEGESRSVTTWVSKTVPLGYQVPAALMRGLQLAGQAMDVNDSHAFVLTLVTVAGSARVLVFRKSDKTWHTLPPVGGRPPYIRGFGRYLAATEVRGSAHGAGSPGMEEWKAGSDHVRPDLRESVEEREQSFPGKLYVYDIETEHFFPITTNQGDSEVLLIEEGVVYYRSADQLFSSTIGDKGLGTPRLIAEDEDILEAHHAFIKH